MKTIDNDQMIVDYLNELVSIDKEAMHKLVEARVECNEELVNHSTVQVVKNDNGDDVVGFLGVLNGLIGGSYIYGCFEYGKLVKFITLSDFQKLSLSLEKMREVDKLE